MAVAPRGMVDNVKRTSSPETRAGRVAFKNDRNGSRVRFTQTSRPASFPSFEKAMTARTTSAGVTSFRPIVTHADWMSGAITRTVHEPSRGGRNNPIEVVSLRGSLFDDS